MNTRSVGMIAQGTLLYQGRYRIDLLLAQTPHRAVYRAWNFARNRPATIIELAPSDEQRLNRALERSAPLVQLDHPSLAAFQVVFVEDDTMFIGMAFAGGQTIQHIMAERTVPIVASAAVRWIAQASEMLEFFAGTLPTWSLGDLSPGALFVTAEDRVQLLSFENPLGLLTPAEIAAELPTGAVAPEMRLGTCDPRSDVYGLAATLHLLLTGKAWTGGDPAQNTALDDVQPELPRPLVSVVRRALRLDPAERWLDVASFQNTLLASMTARERQAEPSSDEWWLTPDTQAVDEPSTLVTDRANLQAAIAATQATTDPPAPEAFAPPEPFVTEPFVAAEPPASPPPTEPSWATDAAAVVPWYFTPETPFVPDPVADTAPRPAVGGDEATPEVAPSPIMPSAPREALVDAYVTATALALAPTAVASLPSASVPVEPSQPEELPPEPAPLPSQWEVLAEQVVTPPVVTAPLSDEELSQAYSDLWLERAHETVNTSPVAPPAPEEPAPTPAVAAEPDPAPFVFGIATGATSVYDEAPPTSLAPQEQTISAHTERPVIVPTGPLPSPTTTKTPSRPLLDRLRRVLPTNTPATATGTIVLPKHMYPQHSYSVLVRLLCRSARKPDEPGNATPLLAMIEVEAGAEAFYLPVRRMALSIPLDGGLTEASLTVQALRPSPNNTDRMTFTFRLSDGTILHKSPFIADVAILPPQQIATGDQMLTLVHPLDIPS